MVSRVRSVRADSQDAERVVNRDETCQTDPKEVSHQFHELETKPNELNLPLQEEREGKGERTFVLNLFSSFSAITRLSLFPLGPSDESLSPDAPRPSSATSRDVVVTNSGLSLSEAQMRGDLGARALQFEGARQKLSAAISITSRRRPVD